MKKFKRFTGVIMLLTAAFFAINVISGGKLISSAASSEVATPTLKYAYAKANGDVTVSFKSVKSATKYRIYRKTANTEWIKITDTTQTTYIDNTTKQDVTYYYSVKACKVTKNQTFWSKYADKVKSEKKYPEKPYLESVNATNEGIKFTWKATKDTTKYIIYRKSDGSEWSKLETTSSTTFVDKDYQKGVTYYYSVKAVKIVDTIKYYGPMDNSGLSCVSYYPVVPKMELAVHTAVGAYVQWNDIENENYYIIYRKKPGTQWSELAKVDANTTTYLDKSAKDYESYYYTVQAVVNANDTLYYSAYDQNGVLMGRTESDFKITSLCLNAFKKPIIKWDQYNNAKGYYVYRKASNENDYKEIKNIKKGYITSYVDMKANTKSEYTYVVKPYFAEQGNNGIYALATINIGELTGELNVNPDKANNATPEENDCDDTTSNANNNATNVSNNSNNSCNNSNNSWQPSAPVADNKAKDIINNVPNTRYKGLSLSVLGDDNSTFSGITSSNNAYYPSGDVDTSDDMWWKKTADKMGMNISKINAVSGRRVTTTKSGNTSAVESCTNIGNANVLIVYVGINDFLNNVPLGTYDCNTTSLTECSDENTKVFTNAYAVMINKIKRNNPGTEIILCTLPTNLCTNGNGDSVRAWNARIYQLANGFGLNVMDFSAVGPSLKDGVHPTLAGQNTIAQKAISVLQ